MPSRRLLSLVVILGLSLAAAAVRTMEVSNPVLTQDPTGTLSTFSTSGPIDVNGAFFKDMGSNGRTCNSCHQSAQAWSITPSEVKQRFNNTKGTDPIFRPVDGANCPTADVSTFAARRDAYSLLMDKGLIRISLQVPAGADFQIINIEDPYNCSQTTPAQPAFYRRPLPSTNLRFLTTVMWDGRESRPGHSLTENLTQQGIDATMGHAEGAVAPTAAQLQEIVAFETSIFTAQLTDHKARELTALGATGGPASLATQPFHVGINDVLGADPTGAPFDPAAFTLYGAWLNSSDPQRASIARGEVLFNSFPIAITGVTGLNDALGVASIPGTCTTCHDTPNVGNHSVPLAINIGVTDYPASPGLDISGLPVYTVQCTGTGNIVRTTDLGRAMVTGKCKDVGKTKGPILRALSARAPYFHNGGAATLNDAVDFYESRFHLGLTRQQKKDLVAFLNTL